MAEGEPQLAGGGREPGWDNRIRLFGDPIGEVDPGPEVAPDVGVQLREHVLGERIENSVDDLPDRPPSDASGIAALVEDYAWGDVGFYVHVIGTLKVSAELNERTALFYGAGEIPFPEFLDRPVEFDCHRGFGRESPGEWDDAVLVDVRQLLQLPESPKQRVLPTVIGLKTLDARLGGPGQPFDFVGSATPLSVSPSSFPPVPWPGLKDGKSGVLRHSLGQRTGLRCRELEDELVQGGAHTVDQVANQCPKVGTGRFDVDRAADDPALLGKIGLDFIEIRFPEFLTGGLEVREMRTGTVKLREDGRESVGG